MRFSIIMPVYNAEKFLCESLDSIISQTCNDWELICVDDGSSDGSGALLEKYAEKDRRIKVIHQRNGGAHVARNAALAVASGEWLGFVDSDDAINKHWLDVTEGIIESEHPDFIRFTGQLGTELTDDFLTDSMSTGYCKFRGIDAQRWQTLPSQGFMCFSFVRREIVGATRFLPDINCKEDSIWLLEMVPRVAIAVQGEMNGYFYRISRNSLTKRSRRAKQTMAYLEAYMQLWQKQHVMAEQGGFLGIMRNSIRYVVDSDVVDWIMMGKDVERGASLNIRRAYHKLLSEGALQSGRNCRRRYRLGLALWQRTGRVWLVELPGEVFLNLRIILNRIKSEFLILT